MFKKKYDLHLPYTYGEESAFDLYSWFKMFATLFFSFFFLIFIYETELIKLFEHSFPEISQKYKAISFIFAGILYLLINMVGLEWSAKKNWNLLFKKLTWKDGKIIIVYSIISLITSAIDSLDTNLILGSAHSNPAATNSLSFTILNNIEDLFQLLGEEFIAIIPFLAFISLGKRFKLNQTFTLIVAAVLSSVVFGMAHTWTYGSMANGILAVLLSRIVITLSYARTKNLWVSYIVHYITDTILFFGAFFLLNA